MMARGALLLIELSYAEAEALALAAERGADSIDRLDWSPTREAAYHRAYATLLAAMADQAGSAALLAAMTDGLGKASER